MPDISSPSTVGTDNVCSLLSRSCVGMLGVPSGCYASRVSNSEWTKIKWIGH